MDSYDLIVIGSGQGAGPLCSAFAKAGRKALLVERVHVGGTCINEGCSLTKTMVASGRVAYLARRAAEYGVRTGAIGVDMATVRQRKQGIESAGVDLVFGTASFAGPKTIRIALNGGGQREATAPFIVINTAGRPASLKVPGMESVDALDSTSVMELDEVPEHLVVAGGGTSG